MVSSSNHDESYDSFVLDPDSLAIVHGSAAASGGRGRGGGGDDGGSRSYRSAATTQLASEVGSTVGLRKDPFLKSVTFFDPKKYYRRQDGGNAAAWPSGDRASLDAAEQEDRDGGPIGGGGEEEEDDDLTCEINDLTHWDIILKDPQAPGEAPSVTYRRKSGILGRFAKVGDSFKRSKGPRLIVEDFEGLVEFSSLEAGDCLVSINRKKIKPSEFSAERAMAHMRQCLETEGVLHVTTENPLGKDIIVNVTVIKPRPDMKYDDLGLIVWNWPFLCVREVKEGSIFRHTAVQVTDQIAAINDIDCNGMNEEKFARCVSALPTEITITLIRRKHRYTGSYS